MISEHASEWLGLPVELFDPEKAESNPPDYAKRIYRLATVWDASLSLPELFERFTANPACSATKAIIIGAFHGDDPEQSSEEAVELLVSARRLLPNLRGIFLGDILSEENEISWIFQTDVSPLFTAYPELEHFRVRGGQELSFGGGIQHAALKSLIVESGGTSAATIREILVSNLPALEHLEIWMGDDNYGGDSSIEDLQPVFEGIHWPKLKYLGLRNCPYADDIAAAIVQAPILGQLETLDLSLGTLGDEGASALLECDAISGLRKLDLHHNYISEEVGKALEKRFRSVDVSSDAYGDDDDRYIAVSE